MRVLDPSFFPCSLIFINASFISKVKAVCACTHSVHGKCISCTENVVKIYKERVCGEGGVDHWTNCNSFSHG